MNSEVLKVINSIHYYVDEYNSGTPESDEKMLKHYANSVNQYNKKYLQLYCRRKGILLCAELRALICNYIYSEDERVFEELNEYRNGIEEYLKMVVFLKKHVRKIKRAKKYDDIEDATIAALLIVEYLLLIDNYLDNAVSYIEECLPKSYCCNYPKHSHTEIENKKSELDEIMKKLKKDPE